LLLGSTEGVSDGSALGLLVGLKEGAALRVGGIEPKYVGALDGDTLGS